MGILLYDRFSRPAALVVGRWTVVTDDYDMRGFNMMLGGRRAIFTEAALRADGRHRRTGSRTGFRYIDALLRVRHLGFCWYRPSRSWLSDDGMGQTGFGVRGAWGWCVPLLDLAERSNEAILLLLKYTFLN